MIKEAAIRQDRVIYTGRRHHDIIHRMVLKLGMPRPIRGEQGFITDTGLFVDRKQAARIAIECGQIDRLKYSDTELFSEDLY